MNVQVPIPTSVTLTLCVRTLKDHMFVAASADLVAMVEIALVSVWLNKIILNDSYWNNFPN